jgi:hypothetical protein
VTRSPRPPTRGLPSDTSRQREPREATTPPGRPSLTPCTRAPRRIRGTVATPRLSWAELADLDLDAAAEADYIAGRDEGKPASERGRWRVFEDTTTITGRVKRDLRLVLRRVFVHSSARAGAAATARARELDRARDDLERLGLGLGSRHYPDVDAVAARVATIARERRVGAYLHTEVGTDPVTGQPTLSWQYDGHALAAEAATDGWYALLTNLPAGISAADVLRVTKVKKPLNAVTGRSKDHSRSPRCSCTSIAGPPT